MSGEGIDIINARIQLVEAPAGRSCYLTSQQGAASYDGCLGIHPLDLGLNVLSKLRIYISTKEKMLYFTPADASN